MYSLEYILKSSSSHIQLFVVLHTELLTPYHLTRMLCSLNAGLLIVPMVSKISVGAEPSTIRPLFFGTNSQSGSRGQTQCQCLKVAEQKGWVDRLKPSMKRFIIKVDTKMPLGRGGAHYRTNGLGRSRFNPSLTVSSVRLPEPACTRQW